MHKLFIYKLIILIFILFSCQSNNNSNQNISDKTLVADSNHYAKGFTIQYFTDYKVITVQNPWEKSNKNNTKYILARNNAVIPDSLKIFPLIKIPIKRIVCLSTTHVAFLDFINQINSIVGVAGSRYVNNLKLRDLVKLGKIIDVGYDQNLNYEAIVSLKPDLVMGYGIAGESSMFYSRLTQLGINVIINNEYLEQSALAKAEWAKFVAAFFDCEELANQKFTAIEDDYNSLKDSVLKSDFQTKPNIAINLPWKGTWYVAGGKSYLALMLADAGGNYLWSDNNSVESLPLNIEAFFVRAQNADIWLNTGTANSLAEIAATDERLTKFKPYSTKQVYNNNLRQNSDGGNDYWESGIVNPHLILRDLVSIIHPELLNNYKMNYYKRLE